MRHYETLLMQWDSMRQMRHYETIGDIMDALGLYETARETETIGDHMRH